MPKTLENYSQEVGRAGRDGQASDCHMFLSTLDIPILEGFARGDTCALRDLELWLQEVALKEPSPDGTLDFNHYVQSKQCVAISSTHAYVINICVSLDMTSGYVCRDVSLHDRLIRSRLR